MGTETLLKIQAHERGGVKVELCWLSRDKSTFCSLSLSLLLCITARGSISQHKMHFKQMHFPAFVFAHMDFTAWMLLSHMELWVVTKKFHLQRHPQSLDQKLGSSLSEILNHLFFLLRALPHLCDKC
jgi:hypothetical protein